MEFLNTKMILEQARSITDLPQDKKMIMNCYLEKDFDSLSFSSCFSLGFYLCLAFFYLYLAFDNEELKHVDGERACRCEPCCLSVVELYGCIKCPGNVINLS